MPLHGEDISAYQCPPAGQLPPPHPSVAIVQVSGGSINGPGNPCYRQEAAWAGPNLEAYIFLDGLPAPNPRGACRGDYGCQSFTFGWNWTMHWIRVAHNQGTSPPRWWLDVENTGQWSVNVKSNAEVVLGAIRALERAGVSVGIYSTWLQWDAITGGLALHGRPLWVPGAGNAAGPGYSAAGYCRSSQVSFAGGRVTLVQYGYTGAFPGSFAGPMPPYDLDYACPDWHPATSLHVKPPVRPRVRPPVRPVVPRPRPAPRAAPVGLGRPDLGGPSASLLQAVSGLS